MDIAGFLNGTEKTPIAVSLNFEDKQPASRATSRAANGAFEANDQLVAYFRHVTATETDGVFSDIRQVKSGKTGTPDLARLVNLKVSALHSDNQYHSTANNYDQSAASTLSCTDTQGLYWDDFSEGGKGDATDLRTDGHYLQSYYGYCYNGGTSNFTLSNAADGTITCTLPYDQSTAAAVQHSDLLWSGEQIPQAYAHWTSNQQSIEHGKIEIPYFHAMSMFTVELIARKGFVTGAFANTVVEMQGMNRTCTATAPTLAISNEGTASENSGKIKMYGATEGTSTTSEGTYPSRIFCAIAVPNTTLTADNQLLTLTDVNGNKYIVKITSDMLTAWASGLDGNKTKSGYNYKLTITLDKQTISVESTLANWVTLTATGNGEIQFPDDVKDNQNLAIEGDDGVAGSLQFTAEDLKKFSFGSSFDLYELISTNTTHGNNDFDGRKTISTYTDMATDPDMWVNTPEIYWPNSTDRYYFRAVAECTGETSTNYTIQNTGTTASLEVTQGKDIVWGTTAAHDGYNGTTKVHTYEEGAPINPRTGEVPIAFRHIMSKITVKLATPTGDPTPANAVDLNGALISISKLATTGTVQLYAGSIQNGAIVDSPITGFCSQNYIVSEKTKLDNYIVVPQTLTDDCKLTVTLANGAIYSLKLKECFATDTDGNVKKDSEGNPIPITSWAPGRHYTYTITLEKEKITFRAMIKEWDPVEGGGKATLEWD